MASLTQQGTVPEVFLAFLRLGCISFGGPIAHLGYFQKELVARREWCDEDTFAEVIALAQSLPGPSSSQVCFALGVLRAGWFGGLAAWVAFTLPSALLMFAFAFGAPRLSGPFGASVIHGLQLAAVAVVAQAVQTMQRSLAPDRGRMALALVALAIVAFGQPRFASLFAVVAGALAGVLFFRSIPLPAPKPFRSPSSRLAAFCCAVLLLALLVLPFASHLTSAPLVQVFAAFSTCGTLVFGGGHVVLPLLENAIVAPGWVKQSVFLSGYGAAQALPGPLFTFGGFLGASIVQTSHRLLFGFAGLIGLSAPGLLAMGAVLPFWQSWRKRKSVQNALRGVNAAVVGVLTAALFKPLWVSTIHTSADFCCALLAFVLLVQWKLQPIAVVGLVLAFSLLGAVL